MTTAVYALATLLPVVYLLVTLLFGMEFAGPRAPRPVRLRVLLVIFLLLLHGVWLSLLGFTVGHLPVTDPWTALSFMAFCLLVVYMLTEWAAGTPSTGVFVMGFAFVLQLLASCLFSRDLLPSQKASSPFFAVHVVTALVASASLLLSGFYGGLYLLLLRQLRARRFGPLFQHLPNLESLSRLNRGAAVVGFILLTVGLNLGIWWAHSGAVKDFNYLDPKVLPMILLWLLFGVVGASRWLRFISERRAAVVTVAAAGLFVCALVISFLPQGSFHDF
jgi:ABC-type uncharacterized transport system permease subunit